ncbi:MAG TPA: hypothetical protein PKC25_03330 [Candidatus Rifleibacterium sp.]|nr:hypothetical protein [Candidatus Rifleibacterium sp.]
MKKFLVILLGFCFAVPAFAGTIGAVSNEAWLDHVSQMQSLRQQIMALVTKSNSTVEDRQNLELLNLTFAEKKAEWEQYLESVAQGKQTETEVKKADEPAKVERDGRATINMAVRTKSMANTSAKLTAASTKNLTKSKKPANRNAKKCAKRPAKASAKKNVRV